MDGGFFAPDGFALRDDSQYRFIAEDRREWPVSVFHYKGKHYIFHAKVPMVGGNHPVETANK